MHCIKQLCLIQVLTEKERREGGRDVRNEEREKERRTRTQ
jgi:hypothetical protein